MGLGQASPVDRRGSGILESPFGRSSLHPSSAHQRLWPVGEGGDDGVLLAVRAQGVEGLAVGNRVVRMAVDVTGSPGRSGACLRIVVRPHGPFQIALRDQGLQSCRPHCRLGHHRCGAALRDAVYWDRGLKCSRNQNVAVAEAASFAGASS